MQRAHSDWPYLAQIHLETVREAGPLVHCLTNNVTTNLVANAILAVGASPAMVDIPGEAGPFATVASGVLINLGTGPTELWNAAREAAQSARRAGTPFVLDPVAAGALPLRTALAHDLIEIGPAVIRGNASEIRAIAGAGAGGKGVDSTDDAEAALDAARELAQRTRAVVAVSGETDLITDGDAVIRVANGDPMLTRMTGAGCALGGVIAAFVGANEDTLTATAAACAIWTIAAEEAMRTATGPGSLQPALLDALHSMDEGAIARLGRIS